MQPLFNRRRFLAEAACATAAGTLAGLALTQERPAMQPIPVVDTHVHLWDLRQFRLPWVQPGSSLARNYTLADYRQAIEGANVVKGVYMEVDVDPTQQQAEADFVAGLCQQGERPLVAAVVSGRPADEGFRRYAEQFRNHRYIKGIRQVLHVPATPPGYCLGERFVAGVRLLGQLGLSFDLCMRQTDLNDAIRLAELCPDTRLILDHCGNADVHQQDRTAWRRAITELAGKPNVMCKISGILASTRPGQWTVDDLAPIVNHCLDVFGPDRVMWASDWPVVTLGGTLRQWLDAVREIVRDRPEADQRKLFHDNAIRFYGLAA
jgi:L-fuconolactonase